MPGAITSKPRNCQFILPETNHKCGKEFIPKGNRQIYCEEHYHPKMKPMSRPVPHETVVMNTPKAMATPAKMDCLHDHLVLEVLIAAGFVTKEKVDQARKLVKGSFDK